MAHNPVIKLNQCRLRVEGALEFVQKAQTRIAPQARAELGPKVDLAVLYLQKAVQALQ